MNVERAKTTGQQTCESAIQRRKFVNIEKKPTHVHNLAPKHCRGFINWIHDRV